MRKAGVVSLTLVLALLPTLCMGTDLYLSQSTVAGGFGHSSSGNHRVLCAAGQALAGAAGNDTYIAQVGCMFQPPQILAGVEDLIAGMSANYRLAPNHPNPFRSSTTIRFAVPERTHVSLRIYDVRGREVRTLLDGEVEPGYQTLGFDGCGLASGVYYCRMVSGRFEATRKLVVLR